MIFTSDNGPVLDDGYVDQANEKLGNHRPAGPLRVGKYSLFAGGTQVPMLVRWPGHVRAGAVSPALFGQVDLAASLARLTDTPLPKAGYPDSRDASDALVGKDLVGRPHLVHEAGRLAPRLGPWEYIPRGSTRDGLGPWISVKVPAPGFLHNISKDPGEVTNVADQYPDQLKRMADLLDHIRQHPDRQPAGPVLQRVRIEKAMRNRPCRTAGKRRLIFHRSAAIWPLLGLGIEYTHVREGAYGYSITRKIKESFCEFVAQSLVGLCCLLRHRLVATDRSTSKTRCGG